MFGSILVFLVVLSVFIFIHEMGHFIAAKRSGIWVEEFGFGLPPRIVGKKIGETIYSLNLLPFGGFVRLHGENPGEKIKDSKRSFQNKDKRTRAKILTAGVFMNFISAILCFAIVYSFMGIPKESGNVKVVEVSPGSPAQTAGILVGDIIRGVEGNEVKEISEFTSIVSQNLGKRVGLQVERDISGEKEERNFKVVPRENPPEEEGPLGVVITSSETYYPPTWKRPFVGIYYGFKEAIFWGGVVLVSLFEMFKGLFMGQVPEGISGPVGIFAVTTEAAKYGVLSLVNFFGILSVNLAILNILPFPALDGGRLLFIAIEAVIGKKILPKLEAALNATGMILLISLLIAVTAKDIQRLISTGSISAFLDSIVK